MDDVQSLIEELRFGAENGADAELLERAADKIQELVADLGDADAMTEYWMKKNKWIRCEDRLPEKSGRYLTYNSFQITNCYDYSVVHKMWNCLDWMTKRQAKHLEIGSVKYWMPILEVE